MIKTIIISGFPAAGKTGYCKNVKYKNKIVLDSDSSDFSWIKDGNGNNTNVRNPEFPKNYIEHIKNNIGKVDIIFVSSHAIVRKALEEANLKYILVYPKIELKEEYLNRYRNRGNNEKFINFINTHWNEFINDMKNETFPYRIELKEGQYISNCEAILECKDNAIKEVNNLN